MTQVIERELCQAWGLPVPYYCQAKPLIRRSCR